MVHVCVCIWRRARNLFNEISLVYLQGSQDPDFEEAHLCIALSEALPPETDSLTRDMVLLNCGRAFSMVFDVYKEMGFDPSSLPIVQDNPLDSYCMSLDPDWPQQYLPMDEVEVIVTFHIFESVL